MKIFRSNGCRWLSAGIVGVAVFRPSNGVWYLLNSSTGFAGVQYGAVGDRPSPGAYLP